MGFLALSWPESMRQRPHRRAGAAADCRPYQRVEASDRTKQRTAAGTDGAASQRRILTPGRAPVRTDHGGEGNDEGD
jgi:hypothetical protein